MLKTVRRSSWLPVTLVFLFLSALGAPLRAESGHSHKGCSVATLNGDYGFYRAGSTPDGTLAALGLLQFDGKGNFHVTQSVSKGGNYNFDVSFDGQYEVADDCTGKGFLDGDEFARMVVFGNGNGLYIFSESEGNAVYGVGTRTQELLEGQ